MPTLDVFKQDAFSMQSLTAAIEKVPYKPARIGALGLFAEDFITTVNVMVEEKNGQLSLIPDTPRGAPASTLGGVARTARPFRTTHLVRDSNIMADAIQGVRAFGSETELEVVQSVVNRRLLTLRAMHEVTLEHLRIGAIKGLILDADGTTPIYNLFTEFGVSQQTHAIQFSVATTDVNARVIAMKRLIEDELGGLAYDGIRVFCSAGWFDSLVGHATVKETFKYQQGQVNRSDLRKGFVFGDVTFEEYRGAVGGVPFIPADEAYAFPEGVVTEQGGLFTTYFAPADFIETVNTPGLPIYVKQAPDPEGLNRFIKLHSQSNPLPLCLIPRAVVKLTKS